MKESSIVRNRRYVRLNELKEKGCYEEQEVMIRYPQLYYQYVGKYKTSRNTSFRTISQFYQAQTLSSQYRRLLEKSQESMQIQGEQQNIDKIEEDLRKLHDISKQDLQLQQQQLLDYLDLLFLDGKDPTVDYSLIDENPKYDNVKIQEQDYEDKYFEEEEHEEGYNDPENNTGIQDF